MNEMKQSFYNAVYFAEDGAFHAGGFSVMNGRFCDVGAVSEGEDLQGAYVIPGLLDIHTHGNSGYDFSSCNAEELEIIAKAHAKAGVVGFCPTSMTLPAETLEEAFSHAARLYAHPPESAARVLGVNMEGPFLSPQRKGAQNAAYLRKPDMAFFRRMQQAARGRIHMIDMAPELPGALAFIKAVRDEAIISLAHSDADYDEAKRGFEAGITHVTHMFNAIPGISHRAPGPIIAAAERKDVMVELIADGVHIHPAVIRVCYALFGAERICLVSDSMEACGMGDGVYQLGGQTVKVKGALATLEDGTIAGSVTSVYTCMRNCISWGIRREDAVRAATLTPAKRLHAEEEYGSITNGKRAGFLIVDEGFHIKKICIPD
ncbi:MAG: N-acetylglucosamine-6-phosphate deacetylase [Clostridiales bacterium]|jgi:N-acetylglucosamine-6-phosphate deacetylase|nr:N-acetylglucosamine-6-phosphate deacetylase [Clostridiales bacterium]